MLFGVSKATRAEALTSATKNTSASLGNSSQIILANFSQQEIFPDLLNRDVSFLSQLPWDDSLWSPLAPEMNFSAPSKQSDESFEGTLYYLQLLQQLKHDAGYNTTNLVFLQQLTNLTQDVDLSVVKRFSTNLRVSDSCLTVLLTAYATLMVVGAVGNCLVVAAVIRNAALRTARNLLLFNLAMSDVLLCVLTMPLTLLEIVTQHWPLGVVACRAAGSMQATAVFSSTLTIVAIALDRYMVIVHPTKAAMGVKGVTAVVLVIWLTAFLFALPNLIWRQLEVHEINLSIVPRVAFCYEKWPPTLSRAYYSIATLAVQFFLPILTIIIAHCGISRNLRRRRRKNKHSRMVKSSKIKQDEETGHSNNISVTFVENTAEQRSSGNLNTMGFSKPVHAKPPTEGDPRLQKVNQLLCAITVVFCLSWLPLNLFNCIFDTFYSNNQMTENMLVLYAVCHLCGMSSACSNPFLYGWLNNNFRNEFSIMFACCSRRRCSCLRPSRLSQQSDVMLEPRSKFSVKSTRISSTLPLSSFAKVSGTHLNGGAALETSLNDAVVPSTLE